ncbi:MAG: hypothetical protein BGP25_05135 [Lysobacterales bacterium 63-13]|nr:MAG: hypothetical protein BGP25_05135 [Xanthomonadales bacterium 63-13]
MSQTEIEKHEELRRLIAAGLTFSKFMSVYAESNTDYEKELIAHAREASDYEIEIDDVTIASVGDEKARSGWVLAWVWTELPDAGTKG